MLKKIILITSLGCITLQAMKSVTQLPETLASFGYKDEIPHSIQEQIELLKKIMVEDQNTRQSLTKYPAAPAKELSSLIIRLQMQKAINDTLK